MGCINLVPTIDRFPASVLAIGQARQEFRLGFVGTASYRGTVSWQFT